MRPEGHDKVVALFEELPKGAVLDAACGEGALSLRLRKAGFKVRCCDIDPALMKAEGFENKELDLNTDPIDYPDASFDYVACVNGLHRAYNIQHPIAEFARLLKPGGKLVICIPNYSGIVRRVRFLMTGVLGANIVQQEYRQVTEKPQAHFRNALTAAQLCRTLAANGFTISKFDTGRRRKRTLWLSPFALLVKLTAPFVYFRRRGDYGLDVSNSAKVLFGGHHVYVVATKDE